MHVTNVYVDGFNLYYGALRGTPNKWLDLSTLLAQLFPSNRINRIRYFTALVDGRPPDLQQPVRQQTYLRALQTIDGLTIHYGQFQTRETRMRLARPRVGGPKTASVLKTEEKGSDVNLGSHLLLDAFRKDCEVAIVVSNDADLKTPVDMARNELDVRVGVLNPHPREKRSRDLEPTFFKQLRSGPVAGSQFPEVMRDANGEFRRPSDWISP
ncbi:MAG: NYN domain-containing protein [Solirubrobacteraceae bacterium]